MTAPKKGFSALRKGVWWIKDVAMKAVPRPVPKADTQRQDLIRKHARQDHRPSTREKS